jgi:hypothetical protein
VVPLAQARQYAARLVGAENLDRALADEWITRQIHTNGFLYHTNFLRTGRAFMPELMIGPVITFGPLNDVKDLYSILQQHLDLK